jgi:hypothetical protein
MRSRPAGIWIIVILQIATAVTLLPGVAETFPGISPIGGMPLSDLARWIYVAWAFVAILAALWLWTLSRRGWALIMVLTGLGLIANLVLWYTGNPNFVRMAIQAATALYLNTAAVQQLFLRQEQVSTIQLSESDSP